MKSVVIQEYGGAEKLQLLDIDKPTVAAEEVLVSVHGASVNPVDWKIRRGDLKIMTGWRFPKVLGVEVAGVVDAVGSKVTSLQIGNEVFGLLNPLKGGAYAEYVTTKATNLVRKPRNLSFQEAAVVPATGLTAFQALIEIGKLGPEQHVLINGASGGVGHMAVQVVKAVGATVTAVCSQRNLAFCQSLGADHVIDYGETDLSTLHAEYDVVFDTVGNCSFSGIKSVLKDGGYYVTTRPTLTISLFGAFANFFRARKLKAVSVRPDAEQLTKLRGWIEQGQLMPVIDRVFKMEDMAAAHQYSESGKVVGKIAITIG